MTMASQFTNILKFLLPLHPFTHLSTHTHTHTHTHIHTHTHTHTHTHRDNRVLETSYVQTDVICWKNWLSCIRLSKKEASYILGVIQNFSSTCFSIIFFNFSFLQLFYYSEKNKTDKFITEFSKNKFSRKKFRLEFLLVSDPSAKFLTFFFVKLNNHH